MTTQQLVNEIKRKKSFLCIGLDVDLTKIPSHLLNEEDPIFAFNKAIIDATHHLCVAYKPNTAFYEAYGIKGWKSLEKTIKYLNEKHPEILKRIIAEGHSIGNHTYTHSKSFGFFGLDKVKAELQKTNSLIKDLTGLQMKLYRPAFAVTNPRIEKAIKTLKLFSIGWNVRSLDTTPRSEAMVLMPF